MAEPSSVRVYLSFRRDDAGPQAERLSEFLSTELGADALLPWEMGMAAAREDWAASYERAVWACDVMLVFIGPKWLTASGAFPGRPGPRLNNPSDFVRQEIAAAFRLEKRVLPVLVNGAQMPAPDDLPGEIAPLARRNAIELADSRWRYDAIRLVETLRRLGTEKEAAQEQPEGPRSGGEQADEPQQFSVVARAYSDMPSPVDVLGFNPLVRGLEALLNDEHTKLPLAITVTAPWGAGKSSVMLQLRERLGDDQGRGRHWYTVAFDAWKYEKSERLWAALAKAIHDQPQAQMTRRGRVRFRVRLECKRLGVARFAWRVLGPLVAAGVATAAAIAAAPAADDGAIAVGGSATAAAATVAALGRYWGVVSTPFKRAIDNYVSHPDYESQLGFTSEADRDIDCLIETLADGGKHAVAIFVDDLDRCSHRYVVEAIEAINQIFNLRDGRPCAFVLGMDREVVAASIDVFYRDTVEHLRERGRGPGGNFGVDFLAKISQLSVAIPEPDRLALETLLTQVTGNEPPDDDLGRAPTTEANDGPEPVTRRRNDVRRERAFHQDVDRLRRAIRRRKPTNPVEVADAARALREQHLESGRGELDEAQEQALSEAVRQVRAELLSADSDDVARAEFALLRCLKPNPREVKRFDNAFRLQLHIANSTPGSALDFGEDQLIALGKWVAIRLRWPELAEALDDHPELLAALEARANRPNGAGGLEPDGRWSAHQSWFENAALSEILREERAERLTSELPLTTFLRVA